MPRRSSLRPPMVHLSYQQEMFCVNYINQTNFNAAEASRQAGFAEGTGAKLLKEPVIIERIQQLMDDRAQRVALSADRVLEEIMKLAFSDIRDYYNEDGTVKRMDELSDSAAAALQTVKVHHGRNGVRVQHPDVLEFKLADKRANLELLGKHLKLFTDRQEHTFPDGVPPITIKRVIVDAENE